MKKKLKTKLSQKIEEYGIEISIDFLNGLSEITIEKAIDELVAFCEKCNCTVAGSYDVHNASFIIYGNAKKYQNKQNYKKIYKFTDKLWETKYVVLKNLEE